VGYGAGWFALAALGVAGMAAVDFPALRAHFRRG